MTVSQLIEMLTHGDNSKCTVETIPREQGQTTTIGWYEPGNGEKKPSGGDGPVRGQHGIYLYAPPAE